MTKSKKIQNLKLTHSDQTIGITRFLDLK